MPALLTAWLIAAATSTATPPSLSELAPFEHQLKQESISRAIARLGSDVVGTAEVTMIKPPGWRQVALNQPTQRLRLASDDGDTPRAMATVRCADADGDETAVQFAERLAHHAASHGPLKSATRVSQRGDFASFAYGDVYHGTAYLHLMAVTRRHGQMWALDVGWQNGALTPQEAAMLILSLNIH